MKRPLLYPDLRNALACLYNLHGHNRVVTVNESKSAHDFLMFVQSRNVRRKLQSHKQRQQDNINHDNSNHQNSPATPVATTTTTLEPSDCGSTWLACLAVLCQEDAHDSEKLFCAQTLLHRTRKSKLNESIDIEFECTAIDTSPTATNTSNTTSHLLQQYAQWMEQFHPILSSWVHQYNASHHGGRDGCQDDIQERIKGELTMVTLAGIMYLIASSSLQNHHHQQQQTGPILNTLGSVIAATALRLRYTPASVHKARTLTLSSSSSAAAASTASPLVTMVVQSIQSVVSQIENMQQHALFLCTCACLSSIPDTILGIAGGARGRLSVDSKCIQCASEELREPTTGVYLVWHALQQHYQHHPSSTESRGDPSVLARQHTHIIETCARWAKFLPLPLDFVQQTVPLVSQYLGRDTMTCAAADVGIGTGHAGRNMSTSAVAAPQKAAYAYLDAIYEGATWTVEQILTFSLGLAQEQKPQAAAKKRQSSKSKKRQQENVNNNTDEARRKGAHVECRHRSEMACVATELIWSSLQTAIQAEAAALVVPSSSSLSPEQCLMMDGEGPIGCLCACANACLPHVMECTTAAVSEGAPESPSQQHIRMFEAISQAFRTICSSPHTAIRALTYEPLFTLHSAMITITREPHPHGCNINNNSTVAIQQQQLQDLVVDHLYDCSMRLASSCAYPPHYFLHLELNSNEELEIERNDVRDVLRTLAGSEGGSSNITSTMSSPPQKQQHVPSEASLCVLFKVIQACADAIPNNEGMQHHHQHQLLLPPEKVVHAFSAVAKPLNHVAKAYTDGLFSTLPHKQADRSNTMAYQILYVAINTLGDICERLISAFPTAAMSDVFAVSRLANLATASLSPMLSGICIQTTRTSSQIASNDSNTDDKMRQSFLRTLELCIHAASMSIIHLPELVAESSLGETQYDVRGAMRGPGGEDHVGALSLMRLSLESDELATFIMTCPHSRSLGPPLLFEIGRLHDELKVLENNRGPGVFHGKGVAPNSRRILLNTVSRFAMIVSGGSGDPNEAIKVHTMLKEKFLSPVSAIASPQKMVSHAETVFRVCEAAFDLASFSPELVASLFAPIENNESVTTRVDCMQTLVEAGLSGYTHFLTCSPPDHQFLLQWGRLRGALLALLRASIHPGLPHLAVEAIIAWNQAECEAIAAQCRAGPDSTSAIFNESIIAEEVVPAGVFVRVIGEVLSDLCKRSNKLGCNSPEQMIESARRCIVALQKSMPMVLGAILLESPEPSISAHVDPRPTLSEAWFLSICDLVDFFRRDVSGHPQIFFEDATLKELVSQSCIAALMLLLLTSLRTNNERSEQASAGMTLDGPQTFALMSFLERYFSLGPEMLQLVVNHFEKICGRPGIAIIGAALFRGGSGGLPPYAVECIPAVYESLFSCLGKDASSFGQMLTMSMEVRLSTDSPGFAGVGPGELFAGRLFEKLTERTKTEFIQKTRELSLKDTTEGWRTFKVILKQLCGGKKKDSGYNLKPSPTNWECDRI